MSVMNTFAKKPVRPLQAIEQYSVVTAKLSGVMTAAILINLIVTLLWEADHF